MFISTPCHDFPYFECVYIRLGINAENALERALNDILNRLELWKRNSAFGANHLWSDPPVVLCAKVPSYSIPLVAHKRLTPHSPNRTRSAAIMCEINRIQNRSRPRVGSEPCEDFLNSREIRVSGWFIRHTSAETGDGVFPPGKKHDETVFVHFVQKSMFGLFYSLCFVPLIFLMIFRQTHTCIFIHIRLPTNILLTAPLERNSHSAG